MDAVHARPLLGFADLVRELGGDPARLPGGEALADGAVPAYRQVITLFEAAAATLACPDFAMRLAVRQDGAATFGPLGRVMARSATLADAIRYVCRHTYAHSLAVHIWTRAAEGATFVAHDVTVEGAPVATQTLEHSILSGSIAVRQLTAGRARVRRVHFRHQPVSPPRLYRRYFGCDVRFGEDDNGVYYADDDMRARIASRDPAAYDDATRDVAQAFGSPVPPIHMQVRGMVLRHLAAGPCDAGAVAASLGLHPRTLQRRLLAEGTTFQAVKDEVRRETLFYYLARTTVDLATVSAKLGFSEQAVMSRRCRTWFGTTPSGVRRRKHAPTG